MPRFSFSYVEFSIDYSPHIDRWVFILNKDPMLGHSEEVVRQFSKALTLTPRALEDWESLIRPCGPTPFQVEVVIDGQGAITRIFDVTSPEDEFPS